MPLDWSSGVRQSLRRSCAHASHATLLKLRLIKGCEARLAGDEPWSDRKSGCRRERERNAGAPRTHRVNVSSRQRLTQLRQAGLQLRFGRSANPDHQSGAWLWTEVIARQRMNVHLLAQQGLGDRLELAPTTRQRNDVHAVKRRNGLEPVAQF